MLILTRKVDQELVLDGPARVRIISVTLGSPITIRLGIEAPATTRVRRAEIEPHAVAQG